MNSERMKTIIRARSFWKIDRRKGNYKLPNGETLYDYVERLLEGQMKLDQLAIASDGSFHYGRQLEWGQSYGKIEISVPFGKTEICTFEEQEERIKNFILNMIR